MYCHKCGGQLPPEANFCPRCGSAAAEVQEERQQTDQVETCQIVPAIVSEKWGLFPSDMLQFRAQANGPKGEYVVAESAKIKAGLGNYYEPHEKNKRHAKAVEELVNQLMGQGWQRTGRGDAWYNLQFRRVR